MQIVVMNLTALQTAENFFLAMPKTCRLVNAQTCLYTVITSADAVITFSDGVTDIGTITITQSGCAEGDIDTISLDSTSGGEVELGGSTLYLKIALDGGPGAGAALLTLVFDMFHADN